MHIRLFMPRGYESLYLLTIIILLGFIFLPSLTALNEKWLHLDEAYANGYIAIVAFFFYTLKRHKEIFYFSKNSKVIDYFTVFLIACSLFTAIIAQLSFTLVIPQILIVVLIWLFCVYLYGLSSAVAFLPYCLLPILANPIWDLITPGLQLLTVIACESFLELFNIPINIKQTYIETTAGSFHVARGCSGLAYFLSTLTLGVIFSLEFRQGGKRLIYIILFCAFIGMLSNWIRVCSLIFLGISEGLDHPIIKDHGWHGWLINGTMMFGMIYMISKFKQEEIAITPKTFSPPPLYRLAFLMILLLCSSIALTITASLTTPHIKNSLNIERLAKTLGEHHESWVITEKEDKNTTQNNPKLYQLSLFNGLQKANISIFLFESQRQGSEAINVALSKRLNGASPTINEQWWLIGGSFYTNKLKTLLAVAKEHIKGNTSAISSIISLECSISCSQKDKQQLQDLSESLQQAILLN